VARHAAGHRVDGEPHLHAMVDEQLRELPYLVLRASDPTLLEWQRHLRGGRARVTIRL